MLYSEITHCFVFILILLPSSFFSLSCCLSTFWFIRNCFPLITMHVCVSPSSYLGASETERKLHQKLFQNYNMKVRPARYWQEKVMVRVGMTLSQLVSLVNPNTCTNTYARRDSALFMYQYLISIGESNDTVTCIPLMLLLTLLSLCLFSYRTRRMAR